MSERDELARLIACLDLLDPAPSSSAWALADRILAAGYRKRSEPGSSDIANLRRMADERAESDPLAAMALDGCADEIEALRKRIPEPGTAEWEAMVRRAILAYEREMNEAESGWVEQMSAALRAALHPPHHHRPEDQGDEPAE
jgi:hypothetical protein